MSYSPEQIEEQADRVGIAGEDVGKTADMMRFAAATLRQQAARVDEDSLRATAQAIREYGAGFLPGVRDDMHGFADSIEAALSAQPAERQGEAVAWLHTVTQGDGETDHALSFSPDSFPLDTQLGFRSLGCRPLGYIDTHLAARVGVPKQKTLYDHRVSVDNAARNAGPQLYVALKNLLDAVKERRDNAGIESVVVVDAHNALLAAAPSAPQGVE